MVLTEVDAVTQDVAFVAGATGFVGKALVAELAGRGVPVVAHVRPDSRDLQRWQQTFAALGATVSSAAWEPAPMAAALQECGATLVFCCIGTTRKRMGQDGAEANSYERVDFGLTQLLAQAAAQAPTVRRFVYLSSLGAGPRAAGAYLQFRWRAEEAVRQAGKPWTIARPSFITGERQEERPLEALAASLTSGLLRAAAVVGAKATWQRYRATNDVTLARALARLALDPAAAGQTVESQDLQEP